MAGVDGVCRVPHCKSLLGGGKKMLRFGVGIGGNYVHADHGIGLLKLRRWLEFPAVDLERQHKSVGGKVGSECIR